MAERSLLHRRKRRQSRRSFDSGNSRAAVLPKPASRNVRLYIPLKPGVYEMRLHFAETHFGEMNLAGFGGEGSRAFAILVNGKTLMPRLDVVGEVGARTADIKVFRDISPDSDGTLHLSFNPLVSVPFLNAIE